MGASPLMAVLRDLDPVVKRLEDLCFVCEHCGGTLRDTPFVARHQSDGLIILCDLCAEDSTHWKHNPEDDSWEALGFDEVTRNHGNGEDHA